MAAVHVAIYLKACDVVCMNSKRNVAIVDQYYLMLSVYGMQASPFLGSLQYMFGLYLFVWNELEEIELCGLGIRSNKLISCRHTSPKFCGC